MHFILIWLNQCWVFRIMFFLYHALHYSMLWSVSSICSLAFVFSLSFKKTIQCMESDPDHFKAFNLFLYITDFTLGSDGCLVFCCFNCIEILENRKINCCMYSTRVGLFVGNVCVYACVCDSACQRERYAWKKKESTHQTCLLSTTDKTAKLIRVHFKKMNF